MNIKQIKIWFIKILTYCGIIFTIAVFGLMFLDWMVNHRHKHRPAPRFSCTSNLKQLGLSLKQYAMDYEDFFPPEDNAKGLDKLHQADYLTDYSVYVCPAHKMRRAKGSITEANCDYIYLGGFMEGDSDETGNADTPLAFDKPANHPEYVNVLFLDGHVMGYPTSASKSCEGIIKFLNKEHKYPPELFNKLLKKAKKIDSTLPKK